MLVGFICLADLVFFVEGDPDEFIVNNIRNRRIASNILNDSILNVDTTNTNSINFAQKFLCSLPMIVRSDIDEINQIVKFETSKYQVVLIRQNFKKFTHVDVIELYIKNDKGDWLVTNNRVGDKVKYLIFDRAWEKYQSIMDKSKKEQKSTNIKFK